MKGKKFYLTAAIDYVNGFPHMGHALEKVQADAIARFRRASGDEVFFSAGTDEHGAKIVRAAERAGRPVAEFVDENADKFCGLWDNLGISYDTFIRTSDKKNHWPAAQEIWRRLEERGDIYRKKYQGLYCVGHEAFVTEKDLTDGKCADHGTEPEVVEEENYFFRLSLYAEAVKKAIESDELKIIPASRKNEALNMLKEGAEDVSFSRPARDISWGIPVPSDQTQTMYVWCDALTNYLSALGFPAGREREEGNGKFNKFWPADLQVIGKDILRFHAIIWPGMLLSAGLPLPRALFTHGFITSAGKKMSKTLGNVIDPALLVEEYGEEALRYYLLREVPPFDDGDITEDRFKEIYNANLANGLGNLVSRTAKMAHSYFPEGLNRPEESALASVPFTEKIGFELKDGKEGESAEVFGAEYFIDNFIYPAYQKEMERYELQKAADIIWKLIGELDSHIQNYQPFKLIKEDPEKTKAVIWNLLYGLHKISDMLAPFMPQTAEKIKETLRADDPQSPRMFSVKESQGLFPKKMIPNPKLVDIK